MAVLLAVLLSGAYLNLPDEVLALAAADARYPGGTLDSVRLPVTADAVYTICRRDVPDLTMHWIRKRCVAVDRYEGTVLHVEDADSGTAGDAFLQWQWYLHSGQVFGMMGRVLVCISGLAGFLLYVTGVIRWLQKRRAARAR